MADGSGVVRTHTSKTTTTITTKAADNGMSGLEFVSSMTDSLAWPLSAVLIASLFRVQIRKLIDRIKDLEFGGAKATLVPDLLDEAEATAETLPELAPRPVAEQQTEEATPSSAPPDSATMDETQRELWLRHSGALELAVAALAGQPYDQDKQFNDLLRISPNAAVLDAWHNIERQIRGLAAQYGVDPRRSVGVTHALDELARQEVVPLETSALVKELRYIRNKAAHSEDVRVEDAARFYSLVKRVQNVLDEVARKKF